MPDLPEPTLDGETIRRFASEQVRISLVPSEIESLKTLLSDLLGEIRQMKQSDRGSIEPESGVVVSEWPS